MVRLPDGRYDVRCRDGHNETVTAEEVLANRVCKPSITLYQLDDCQGEAVAKFDESTPCESLEIERVYSVSMKGICSNLGIAHDLTTSICHAWKGALSDNSAKIYSYNAGCFGTPTAFVSASTHCSRLGEGWAQSVETKTGQCTQLTRATVDGVCRQVQ